MTIDVNPVTFIAFGLTVYLVTFLAVDILRMWALQREARATLERRWREWASRGVV